MKISQTYHIFRIHVFFYKQPGCLALTRKICPKVKQLAKQPLRVKFKKILQRVEK